MRRPIHFLGSFVTADFFLYQSERIGNAFMLHAGGFELDHSEHKLYEDAESEYRHYRSYPSGPPSSHPARAAEHSLMQRPTPTGMPVFLLKPPTGRRGDRRRNRR